MSSRSPLVRLLVNEVGDPKSDAETGWLKAPLKVFLTVDVELWPRSWAHSRAELKQAFDRYILGATTRGQVGLPFQLRMAQDHGLRFSFFVESLFACEMGIGPLADIVSMITEAGQEVQLHLHPEWLTHAAKPALSLGSRFLFEQLNEEEQHQGITLGLANLAEAGITHVRAFRAGSFSANVWTLAAVKRAGLVIDCSLKLGSALPGTEERLCHCPTVIDGVAEYPLASFGDWPGHLRGLQLAACSLAEITYVLQKARSTRWNSVVVLSHSAELLTEDRSKPDRVLIKRFEGLCRFLAEGKLEFPTSWLRDEDTEKATSCLATPITSAPWRTAKRFGEQAWGRVRARM